MNALKKKNLISQAECARRLGCAKSLISRWVKDGRLKRHGKFVDLGEAVSIQEKVPKPGASVNEDAPVKKEYDLFTEKARTEHFTAELRELEFKKKSGQLVEIDLVSEHLDRSFGYIKQRFLSSPQKLSALVFAAKNVGEVRGLLHSEITEILNELSEYRAESGDPEFEGGLVSSD